MKCEVSWSLGRFNDDLVFRAETLILQIWPELHAAYTLVLFTSCIEILPASAPSSTSPAPLYGPMSCLFS